MMKLIELNRLIPAPRAATIDFEGCLAAFPALERAKTTPQDPTHHGEGNVWIHTQLVLCALVAHADYALLSESDRFVVFLAALLHDVAKADTTVIDPVTGKISQPGHSKRGAIDARVALWRLNVPFAQREAICALIAVHQVPFWLISSTEDIKRRVHCLSWELDTRLLALLADADMLGRICPDHQSILDDIQLFRELCLDEHCYGNPRAFVDSQSRLEYARHGKGHPDYALHGGHGSEVIVMCGLPASGKDTWIQQHVAQLPVVSFDDAKAELGLKHGQNDGQAAHFAVDKAKALLRKKAPFVWNATHLSGQMRDKTLDLLYNYDAKVHLVYLEQPESMLMARNSKRDSTLTNDGIRRMLHRWEVPAAWEAQQVSYFVEC